MNIRKKPEACRSCGGTTIIGENVRAGKKASFAHVIYRCRSCGAWCGGYTIQLDKQQKQDA